MNFIRSIWGFKLKRYPHGIIKMLKARLCARGDIKLKVIYLFETYAPFFNVPPFF